MKKMEMKKWRNERKEVEERSEEENEEIITRKKKQRNEIRIPNSLFFIKTKILRLYFNLRFIG